MNRPCNWWGIVSLVLALGGCKGQSSGSGSKKAATVDAAPPKRPVVKRRQHRVKLIWKKSDGTVVRRFQVGTCSGELSLAHPFATNDKSGFLSVAMNDDCPNGAFSEVGGQKITPLDSERFVDVRAAIGNVTWKQIYQGKVAPALTLTVDLPNGDWAVEPLPPLSIYSDKFGGIFWAVDKGPVRLGEEKPDPYPRDSLLYRDRLDFFLGGPDLPGYNMALLGHRGTLSEIDFVALEKEIPAGTKTCKGYGTLGGGGGRLSITVEFVDSMVKVYDRRTGKLLKERRFRASRECPYLTNTTGMNAKVGAQMSDIRSWLKRQIRRRTKRRRR